MSMTRITMTITIDGRFYEKHYTKVDSKHFDPIVEGMYRAVLRRVLSMEQMELQHTLLQLLFNGPSRQLARFIRENGLEDEG